MGLCDLLSLSRTTKAFRRLLLAPDSKRFWTSAMENSEAEGVPPCPPWLNILEYANLLYSPHCHVRVHPPIHSLQTHVYNCYVLELFHRERYLHFIYILRMGCTLLQEMSR